MIDAFVEGVRSIIQACHLVILGPVAMTTLAARGRWQAVAGAVVGVVLGGFVFVTRWLIFSDLQLRLSALVVIVALAAVSLPALFRPEQPAWMASTRRLMDLPAAAFAIAAGVGAIVTLWWRPCVGEELGEILTRAPDEPLGQLVPTIGFMLGISIPLVIVGLIYTVWQPAKELASKLGLVAATLGTLLAGSVIVGQHGEIVSKLFEWSQ